jgi:hypothetical protein
MAQHDERMEEQQEETRPASEVGSKTDASDEPSMTQEQQETPAVTRSDDEPVDGDGAPDTGGPAGQEDVALFEASEQEAFWDRWSAIQTSFVDEPRRSVEEANDLVADLMNRLVSSFRDEQSRLEEQWSRGEEVTTEDLRMTLQRYRSFFGRVLKL